MSKKKKGKAKKPKVWKYKVGDFAAYERTDRGLQIWTRVGPFDGKYEDVRLLCGPIRNGDGKIDPELETLARAAADARRMERGTTAATVATDVRGPMTLRAACRLAVDPKQGKYIGKKGWDSDVRDYLVKICNVPFTDESDERIETLGDVPIEKLRHAHYQWLWRWMAEEHMKSGRFGLRAIEMACGILSSAISWLELSEKIPQGVGRPARRWKAALHSDWLKITEKPIRKPKRPRYTPEEKERLFAALPQADPRIAMALEIGAELRLGQVIARTRRSEIVAVGGHEIGMVIVHGAGKKKGAEVVLTDDQRSVLIEAMTSGYLSEVERAYKAGTLPDYLLIAGGYFAKGKAQVENAMMPLGDKAAHDYWADLEKLAGVEHITGRGWYGMRRRQSDDAEDETPDARVLNNMGGWDNTETRTKYQQEGRLDIAQKTADVRSRIRPARKPKSGQIIPLDSTTREA